MTEVAAQRRFSFEPMRENEALSERPTGSLDGHEHEILAQRLREAGLSDERFIDLLPKKKYGNVDHTDPENQFGPELIDGNCGVMAGGGLVILDVDIPISDLPDRIADLPSTSVIESPHGGYHVYYVLEDDTGISNTKTDWGSIRYEGQFVVGPGSIIDHALCNHGKDGCSGEGIGKYEYIVTKPTAALTGENLDRLREACGSDNSVGTRREAYGGQKITLPDDATANEGERYICADFTRHHTELAGQDKMDLLRGGTGSYDLRRDDGAGIDQSAADYYSLDILYGAFLFRGEDEGDARRLTLAVFKRYCRENPYDKTGHLRKWLRKGESYLLEQMDSVQREFDRNKWNHWRRREHDGGFDAEKHKPWLDPGKDGEYSDVTHDIAMAIIRMLTDDLPPEEVEDKYGIDLSSYTPTPCGEIPPPRRHPTGTGPASDFPYPSPKEVREICAEVDNNSEATYKTAIQRLQQDGHLKVACLKEGVDYRVYPKTHPDPPNAEMIRCGGEEYEPGSDPGDEDEQELLTDGGTQMSESQEHVERIRRAKNDEQREERSIHRCPLCGSCFVEVGSMRVHVTGTTDDDHRGLTLDDELNPIEQYKIESELREHYVEREKTQQEIADEWGCSRNTIQRWMDRHDIPRRDRSTGGGSNRVEYALYTYDGGGYPAWRDYTAERAVKIHQLLAIAEGADPRKVFSNGAHQVHHVNGISWDNRPENIELLTRKQHLAKHGNTSNISISEYLYGDWGHPDWNPQVKGVEKLPESIRRGAES